MRATKKRQYVGPGDHVAGADTYQEVESLVVAHYAVEENMSYESIQAMTGLSRATVARRLQYAKSAGWLVERPVLTIPHPLAAAYEEKIRDCALQRELTLRLRSYGVRAVCVVPDKQVMPPEHHEVHQRIGQASAARISGALAGRTGYVGVNWGHSVRYCIQQLTRPSVPSDGLVFVPLMGNLSVDESNEKEYEEVWLCSANRLAGLASQVFSGSTCVHLTTPAIIPRLFMPVSEHPDERAKQEETLTIIWSFIMENISYNQVFGAGHHDPKAPNSGGLIGELDTIITGMSGLQIESALFAMAKLVTEPELRVLRDGGFAGDLGGHPIRSEAGTEVDPKAERLANAVSRLVVSPKPGDFVRVAEKARILDDDRKGVFLMGQGKAKAEAFVAACRMRAVNELFTSRETAAEMLRILGGVA